MPEHSSRSKEVEVMEFLKTKASIVKPGGVPAEKSLARCQEECLDSAPGELVYNWHNRKSNSYVCREVTNAVRVSGPLPRKV